MKANAITYKLLLLLLTISIFTGCKKDEDSNDSNSMNKLTYDSQQYSLSKGLLGYYGGNENNDLKSYLIFLHSSGISFNSSLFEVSGKGDYIDIELNTLSSTSPEGTYSFDDTTPYAGMTFFGDFSLDYDFTDEIGEVESDLRSGTLTVTKSGSEYEITINGTNDNGKTVTAYYKGKLDYYDWSDIDK